MKIILTKASINDADTIHKMQIKAFAPLLEKYQDYDISPGAEKIEKIIQRIKQNNTDYYLISYEGKNVGAIRIIRLENGEKCRISPLFVLPEYQNMGIAQKLFKIIEEMYKPKKGWCLDTIIEETGNCYLYEKMGYVKTGQIEKLNEKMHIVYYEKK